MTAALLITAAAVAGLGAYLAAAVLIGRCIATGHSTTRPSTRNGETR